MGKEMKYITLMDYYGSLLTDKQRNAMELYYYDDLSLSEIAEHTKTTRQGVHDNIRRAENTLTELESKLGFIQNNCRLNSILSEIYEKSSKMITIGNSNQEIVKLAEDISQLIKNSKNFLIDFGT